ncbi:MAG TPA: LLM class flavin-dependent oxidoreductase [Allosphingosinicella sp.]|nr:LLM class flavin-dependent oxidoreductase [Allosphingosinicella sp.]
MTARRIRLGTVFYGIGQNRWGWLDPKIDPGIMVDLDYHRRVAQEAEAAKLDFIFVGDGPYADAQSLPSRLSTFEPLTLLSALAAVTSRIGLICTQTTSYVDPYTVARQFASLDNLSNGRAGWNVVTTAEKQAGLNFGTIENLEHDERYRRADEHLQIVQALWDSWEDDAFLYDRANRRFFDPEKMHTLDHKGKYFSVKGPLNIQRSPQGQPVIAQAGASPTGIDFGSRVADIIYTGGQLLRVQKDAYGRYKSQAAVHGRSPDALIVMPGIAPIIGSTDAEAERRYEELASLASLDDALTELSQLFGHDLTQYPLDEPFPSLVTEGHQSRSARIREEAEQLSLTLRQTAQRWAVPKSSFIGSPDRIADEMELWMNERAADGFVLNSGRTDSLSDVIEHVLPILRARGLFREEYEATTLRGNLGLPIPANRYTIGA